MKTSYLKHEKHNLFGKQLHILIYNNYYKSYAYMIAIFI